MLKSVRITRNTRELAGMVFFTLLVVAATVTLSVSVSTTGAFFDLGEAAIYVAALLMGPVVGAFAGGVGSMLAALSLGDAQLAPGTLVIKGVEGLVVGYLSRHHLMRGPATIWRVVSVSLAVGVSGALAVAGVAFFTGPTELEYGIARIPFARFNIPAIFWLTTAGLVFLILALLGLRIDAGIGWMAASALAGGGFMVSGYVFYGAFALQLGLPAAAAVPLNVTQMLVGLSLAIPVAILVSRIASRLVVPILERQEVAGSPAP